MAKEAKLTRTVAIGGQTLTQSKTATGTRVAAITITGNAGKAGTLGTRTDDNTGIVVAGASGHGVVDSDRVRVGWAAGRRHRMVPGLRPSRGQHSGRGSALRP